MRFFAHARTLIFSFVVFSNQGCSEANSEAAPSDSGPAPVQALVTARNDCEGLFGAGRLSGASNGFGQCIGACVSELRFDEKAGCRRLALEITGWGPGGQLTDARFFSTNLGVLTDRGVEVGQQAAASLQAKTFLGVYGCPDCTDGGRTELRIQSGAVESTIAYEFGNAPPPLQQSDEFLQALIDALGSCSNSELIDVDAAHCTPRP